MHCAELPVPILSSRRSLWWIAKTMFPPLPLVLRLSLNSACKDGRNQLVMTCLRQEMLSTHISSPRNVISQRGR